MGVYSSDLKIRIVRSVTEDRFSQAETARRPSVSESTVSRTMAAFGDRGTVEPIECARGPSPMLDDTHLEWIRGTHSPQHLP